MTIFSEGVFMRSKAIKAAVFLMALAHAFCFSNPGAQAAGAAVYDQPPDSTGRLIQSSWWTPNGSDYDRYVWEDFTLPTAQAISQITWRGGYDPARFGSGGPVLDFTVAIYASISAGIQPDLTRAPLAEFKTGGNANEAPAGTFAGTKMYDYVFTLPVQFLAAAGTKYWVQIEASQNGIPDWGIASRCSDEDLACYLSGAKALIFPSFDEGYGLPLIEALSLGIPVIAGNLPVFHEIAMLVYSGQPGGRRLVINGATLQEGQEITSCTSAKAMLLAAERLLVVFMGTGFLCPNSDDCMKVLLRAVVFSEFI